MDNVLFINRQNVKLFTVWILRLAVLLGSSGVSLAIPKTRLGKLIAIAAAKLSRVPRNCLGKR
jgi:hypothetical protein